MAGIPLFLFLLTARGVRPSAEALPAVRSSTPRCRHSGRHSAFVCFNYKTDNVFVVKTGTSAIVLDRRQQSLGKAGRYDMFSAVYLAYCRVFVTNDEGQFKALNEVAELLDRDVAILMYDDFKRGLLGPVTLGNS